MLSLLFVFGLLVGIAVAVIAVASVVIAVGTVLAWLNGFVVIMGARIKQSQPVATPALDARGFPLR